MNTKSLRLILCGTMLALLLTACSSAAETPATPQAPAQTPIPVSAGPTRPTITNGLVDVGGRRLMVHCTGQGSPTVILEAGNGDDSSTWDEVELFGDGSFRVCSYDRANLGESDAAPKPRTFLDMVSDLHALLTDAHIGGPYILVGHSMGGMLVRVFADLYPKEVVGIVLVDAAHPDMGSRLMAGLPPESWLESKAIKTTRRYFTFMSNSSGQEKGSPEGVDNQASNEQVKATKPLGDLPLVVISRSPDNPQFDYIPSSLPVETNAELRQIWQDLQGELAGLSSNSIRVIAVHAGHYIQNEEPDLVVDAIRKLVNEAREQMGMAVSPALPADQAHAPRILRVVERQETKDGMLIYREAVHFTDVAGDAVFTSTRLTSGKLLEIEIGHVSGGSITALANAQKQEAVLNATWVCRSQDTFVLEVQIIDQALNKSEPVTLTFPCPAPENRISPYLIVGLAIGLGLLVGVWLLVRYRRSKRAHVSLS